jgi:Kef-type K+ transport system membrane component KefB
MHSEIVLILVTSFIIFVSPFFAKRTKISITPVEIILGFIASYFGLISENESFKLLAEFGFYYLMFLAGIEVELKLLLKLDKIIIRKALLYIASLYALSALFTIYFNLTYVLIVIMPLISVGLILSLQKEFGKDTKWLSLAMSIGIIGEIISIIVLTFTEATLTFGIGKELYVTIGYLLLFLIGIYLVYKGLKNLLWWYPQITQKLMPNFDQDEKDVRISMAIFFLMITLMLFLHLEVAFGAFIAGIFLSTFFEHKTGLPHKLSSFGFGFLIPIFFIYIGSTLQLGSIALPNGDIVTSFVMIKKALILTFVMTFIRTSSAVLIFPNIIGFKNSVLFSLSHAMPLTLLIAVATVAYKTKTISVVDYNIFVLASIFEVLVVMSFIKVLNYRK